MNERRVLVTGASGFIGRWSISPLLARGFDVHAIVRETTLATDLKAKLSGATIHNASLFEKGAIEDLTRRIRATHLLHFAWMATPQLYWTSPDNFRWVAASLALLLAFREAGGLRAVMSGSCAEYDWESASVCHETSTPLASDGGKVPTPYATSKIAQQKLLAAYSRQSDLSSAWGRIFFLYGPFEHPNRLVPSVVNALLDGQLANCSDGKQLRSFLHVSDVASAFISLLDSTVEGPVNIGTDERTTLAEVIDTIAGYIGRRDLVRLGVRLAPKNEPAVLVPDTTRLYQEVGWRPAYALRNGLKSTVEWWCEHRRRYL